MDFKCVEYEFESLAGMISCTNLLEELPMPAPCQNYFSNQTLLDDVLVLQEAKCLLTSDDVSIVKMLAMAMSTTDTNDIEFNEGVEVDTMDCSVMPPLLKRILNESDKFKSMDGFSCIYSERNIVNSCYDSNLDDADCNYNEGIFNDLLPNISTSNEIDKTRGETVCDDIQFIPLNYAKQSDINETFMEKSVDEDEFNKNNEKKKKKKRKKHHKHHKSPKLHSDDESNQYSIKKPNCDSQKIVVSLVKKGTNEDRETKKHKRKKKRSKNKEKIKESKHNNNNNNNNITNTNNNNDAEPLGKIKLKVARNGDNAKIISSTIPVHEKELQPTIQNLNNSRYEEKVIPRNTFKTSCDINSSPTSSKVCVSSTISFGTPTTVDRISQCSTASIPIINCHEPDSVYSTYSKQDEQIDLSIPIDITGEDLLSPLNLNGSNNSILNSVLSENVDSFLLEDFDNATMDQRSTVREPGGLASYLSNGIRELETSKPKSSSPNYKISSHTECIPVRKNIKKQKKRKNELEGLKTWFIGSNTTNATSKEGGMENSEAPVQQESTWDKTINNITQSISDKKRKRNSRQQADSAFVFENDEEYSKATCLVSNDDESSYSQRNLRGTIGTNYIGMDEEGEDEFSGSRSKRRKKDDDEPFEVKLKDPNEIKYPHLKKCQENNKKRRERVVELTKYSNTSKNTHVPSDMLDPSLITESTTYQHFLASLDNCLDLIEEIDVGEILKTEENDALTNMSGTAASGGINEHYIPPDALISRELLQGMCNDIAKLKATGSTKDIVTEKLTKLCTLLMLNIKSGSRVCLPGFDNDGEEPQNRLFKELAVEKIGRSLDSSFIVMNIMTSRDISKSLIIEDVIDSVVSCIKYHLNNLVFPEYDPAYRAKNSAKDNQMSIKWKRAREKETTKSKSTIYFYNRIVDIISTLAELVCVDALTDTVILQLSTIAISVFFVENINEVQLVSLRLITIIFSKYEKHRELIVKDIFSSLNRLPSSKKNLRNYRLNSEESIQMLTVLALLLVQSVVNLDRIKTMDSTENNETKEVLQDREVFIENAYNNSLQTSYNFLGLFLQKATMKGEDDYKAIFDNFVTDLLLTVNKPEWPAAETMLSMLGSLLMKQFTNKHCDQSTRVTCIDYMGNVAATLRRDAVSSTMNEEDIDNVINDLISGTRSSDDDEDESNGNEENSMEDDQDSDQDKAVESHSNGMVKKDGVKKFFKKSRKINYYDKVQILRDAIVDYLEVDKYDITSQFARQYYLGQWFSDCSKELKGTNHKVKPGASNCTNDNNLEKSLHKSEERKRHLIYKMLGELITSNHDNVVRKKKKGFHSSNDLTKKNPNPYDFQLKGSLDYEDACLACRYLASLKSFSQSFDIYISKICRLLDDNSVAVRTKSMRCLSAVVEADPSVLSRKDIENSVNRRFLDSNSSVREAAVELVGKYLLTQPQLIHQYYPMIAERILDKGTSVRKRVIKIFRDICIEHSDFSKVPEICVKMIRRINDEESIKKLVNEVFQNMWFCPVKERETVKLLQKVMNITDVVSACSSIGYEWFDQLLESLLKKEELLGGSSDNFFATGNASGTAVAGGGNVTSEKVRLAEKACKQIVDCLVQNVMRLEEISHQSSNERLVSCLATLYLFTKIRPELMVQHAVTLQPYLSTRRQTTEHDVYIVHYVTRILELTVPLIEHPSAHFISQLEEDMVTLMMTHGKMVLEACVACFAASINLISLNYPLVKDCFLRLYYNLKNPNAQATNRPLISRALFTVGLLCKHFDFTLLDLEPDINLKIFETLMMYAEDASLSCDIRTKAISGIGFLCVRHKEILCSSRLSTFYHNILLNKLNDISVNDHPDLVCCVLDNLSLFLVEEDRRMRNMDSTWRRNEKKESLKEMGDMMSGIGSHVSQLYLSSIMENVLQPWTAVRTRAVALLSLIIRQGLISPVTSVPYLIAAQTDPNSSNRVKADNELTDIDKRFGGFVNIKAVQGIKLSCQLQEILTLYNDPENQNHWFKIRSKICPIIVRGVLDADVEIPLSLNHNLYSMVRSSKQNRRAFLNGLLSLFDDGKSSLSLLIYVSDNLAQFPYQSQEEPLYLVHQIEFLVTSLGPNHIQQIKIALFPELATIDSSVTQNKKIDSIKFDDEEDMEVLLVRVKQNTGALRLVRQTIRTSRACLLLIALKQYLRELYSLTDAKVGKYNPADSGKAWERQLTRRNGIKFDPIRAIHLEGTNTLAYEEIYQNVIDEKFTNDSKGSMDLDQDLFLGESKYLLEEFLQLRQLVLSLDPLDIVADSDDEAITKSSAVGANVPQAVDSNVIANGLNGNVSKTPQLISNHQWTISHQSAVIHGQNLRVELDKLEHSTGQESSNFLPISDLSDIPQLVVNSRRLAQQKKTLVPRVPVISSDEESDDKDKKSIKRTNQMAKVAKRSRPSRFHAARRKSLRESSSEDSNEDFDSYF